MESALTKRPLWFGALIAPLGAPTAFVLYAAISILIREGAPGLADWRAAIFIWLPGMLISYAAMLMLGLPYLLLLVKMANLGWATICAGAVVIGGVSLPLGLVLLGMTSKSLLVNILIGSTLGLVCGALFCLITRPVRP